MFFDKTDCIVHSERKNGKVIISHIHHSPSNITHLVNDNYSQRNLKEAFVKLEAKVRAFNGHAKTPLRSFEKLGILKS